MPQIFQVLKCYKCSVFQVHQTRKDNKWVCKLCGEKQSIKRHYGIGFAKDCRLHVQKLNNMRGEKDQLIKTYLSDSSNCDEDVESSMSNDKTNRTHLITKKSKWTEYVDESQDIVTSDLNYLKTPYVEIEEENDQKLDSKYDNQIIYRKNTKEHVNYNKKKCNSLNKMQPVQNNSLQENIFTEPLQSTSSDLCNNKNVNSQHQSNVLIGNETVAKTSKWHQFVEESVSSDTFIKHCSSENQLFSVCDDVDIDKILDI